jgi:4-hydroxy-2-oxoheptanedioate aldolase
MLNLGKPARGVFVKLPATEVIDLLAASDFDFAVVDLEHSQLAEVEAFRLLRHAQALGFPALARIPSAERGLVNRLLEAGAAGIHLSTVRRRSEVEALARACRYAPEGDRSISLTHPAGAYGRTPLAEYLRLQRDARVLVVPQIETAETDDTLDDIAAAGADMLFAGLTDLSVDVGLDAARVATRLDEIADAAARAGVPLGAFGSDDPRVMYRAITTDLSLLAGAIADAA